MKIKLFLVCLLLFTNQAFAEKFTWELISTTVGKDTKYYGDKNSIRKNSSGNYIVWMLDNDSSGYSIIASEEYDCIQLRYRWLYVEKYTNHFGEGEKSWSANAEQLESEGLLNWIYPKTGTNNFNKVNWVCKR